MKKIGIRDVVLLCIGGVGGFLLCFVPTGSVVAASTAGVVSGMGGICIFLIIERWLKRRKSDQKDTTTAEE